MSPLTTSSPKCVICVQAIDESDRDFAENDENHPGVLGPVHKSCYNAAVSVDPSLPHTDPISGEVDYEAMAEDLGVFGGSGDVADDQEDWGY